MDIDKHYELLLEAALQYRKATGKFITGITGEYGEYFVANILNLHIIPHQNNPGHDAVDNTGIKYQIKTCILNKQKTSFSYKSQFNHISIQQDWDYACFCFLTTSYKVICICILDKIQLNNIISKKYNTVLGKNILANGYLIYFSDVLYSNYISKPTYEIPFSIDITLNKKAKLILLQRIGYRHIKLTGKSLGIPNKL